MSLARRFLGYLRARPLVWILPILLVAAAILILARAIADAPDAPFIYDL